MLPTYWWILASFLSVLAIYYFWGRKQFGKEPPQR
jgi:hypothetical protein